MNKIAEVKSHELRRNLSDFLAQVHYQGAQLIVNRWNQKIARIVPETYIDAIEKLLKQDPALADTLELIINDDLRNTLEASEREASSGHLQPARDYFSEQG